MITVGIDIGSRSSKAVLLQEGKVLASEIFQSSMKVVDRGNIVFNKVLEKAGLKAGEVDYIVATGYGRVSAPFADKTVTEITCHAKGIHSQCPSVRTVIDIGGQDSKVIKLNEQGEVIDFAMNDRCAAGTGKFLEVTSKAMELDLETFSRYYFESRKPCKISSMCTVFAESEVISLLADGNKAQDIVAGLILAVTRRVGNMAKRLKIVPEVAFTGGVAKNQGVRASLEQETGHKFVRFALDPQLNGAYGAAVIAREQALSSCGRRAAKKKTEAAAGPRWKSLLKLQELLAARPAQLQAQKKAGKKVVGFFCAYIPPEIVYAAGMIPIRLNRGGNVEVAAVGNTFLSSYSCPYVCSCVGTKERKADFYFEAVDVVADAPSCLQMKRVLEVWEKYFDVRIIHIGFSRKYYTPEGKKFFQDSIRHFVAQLEELNGQEISPQRLKEAVELFNEIRRRQRRLYRALRNTRLAWSELIRFIQAGNVLDKQDYLELLKMLEEELGQQPAHKNHSPLRILLTGGMLAAGDEKLINIFSELGMDFAMDELCVGSRGTFIDIPEPTVPAIAAAYLENVPCGSLPHPDMQTDPRAKHISRLIKEYDINGILYYTLRFCDAYSFKLRELRNRLEALDIPILHLHSDYSDADIGQIKTRVEAFRESLLRGEGK